MAAKQKEVFKWLAEAFKDSSIPEFEVNEENIELLHWLMERHTEAFQETNHVLDEFEKKIPDYELNTQQLKNILERMKINEGLLKDEEKKSFESLVDVAFNLGLSIPYSSVINPTIYSLETDRNKLTDSLKAEKAKTKDLLRISQSLGKDISDIKRIDFHAGEVAEQQKEELEKDEKKSNFFKEKISNYNDDIAKLEAKLEVAGFDPLLTHETVSKKWKELQDLEKKLEEATDTLARYTLPPDMSLAEAKVEEARKILADTVKDITKGY